MERLIWISWRAFWVGLGASVVLVAQAVLPVATEGSIPARGSLMQIMPARPTTSPSPSPSPAVPPTADVAGQPKSAEPILSRNPFDSKTGPLVPRRPPHPVRDPRGV